MRPRRTFASCCRCLATHYDTLGVSPRASRKDIKQAFHKVESRSDTSPRNLNCERKLSLRFHPDRQGAEASESKFSEVSAAYTTLINDKERRNYDARMQAGPSSSPFSSSSYNPGPSSGPRSSATHAWQHFRRHSPHSAYQQRYSNASHQAQSSDEYDQWAEHFQRMQRRYDRASNLWGSQARLDEEERRRRSAQEHQDVKMSSRLGQIMLVLFGITLLGHKLSAKAEEPPDGWEGGAGTASLA
jgi:DnaJ-class molecular chaperone